MSQAPERIWVERVVDGTGRWDTDPAFILVCNCDEWVNADIHDAEIARLRADLAERDAEVARLREAFVVLQGADANLKRIAAEQPRTDSEWRDADRRKRIFDKTIEAAISIHAARFAALDSAIYAKQVPAGIPSCGMDSIRETSIAEARALAAAVVEAEE